MIELDRAPEPARRPRRVALWAYPLVGLLFVVALPVIGTLAGSELGEEFTAHVAVEDEVRVSADGIRLRGVATVTNVDDEPAVLHAVHADWPGVRIAANEERAHRMPPGGTVPMGVTITMSCAAGHEPGPVGRALVDRADGGRAEVDVPITAARPWHVMRLRACEMLRDGPAG